MSAEFDDYLWKREGHDPEIAELEALLAPLRHRPRELLLPATLPAIGVRRRRRLRRVFALASVAFLVLLAASVYRFTWTEGRPWEGQLVGPDGVATPMLLVPGATLSTPAGSTALLDVARIGVLRVEPESQLRIERTRTGQHRLRLDAGRLYARIWAPPSFFGVSLGETDAIDLGCEFELERAADGSGRLDVLSGWVLLSGDPESLVPAGAMALIDPLLGPGTPLRTDASPALREAVHAIDAVQGEVNPSGEIVYEVLASLDDADGITLLSLLQRYPALSRGPLFERASTQFEAVGSVDRQRLIAGDGAALNAWWAALPYPRVKRWWLHWRDAF